VRFEIKSLSHHILHVFKPTTSSASSSIRYPPCVQAWLGAVQRPGVSGLSRRGPERKPNTAQAIAHLNSRRRFSRCGLARLAGSPRCLDSEAEGGKLFVAFVAFCKPLCLGPETGDFDSQKETKETKGAAALVPKRGAKLCSLCLLM
jgi:hypothetical protein